MAFMQFEGPGFVMETPTNWLITSSTEFQAMFVGPEISDGFRPNLVISIRPIGADAHPKDVAEETRKTQEKEYPQYEILEEIDYSQRGGSGFSRRYTWYSEQNDHRVFQVQTFFILGNALFTLTATTLVGHNQQEIVEIFDHMLDTFRFTTPNPA